MEVRLRFAIRTAVCAIALLVAYCSVAVAFGSGTAHAQVKLDALSAPGYDEESIQDFIEAFWENSGATAYPYYHVAVGQRLYVDPTGKRKEETTFYFKLTACATEGGNDKDCKDFTVDLGKFFTVKDSLDNGWIPMQKIPDEHLSQFMPDDVVIRYLSQNKISPAVFQAKLLETLKKEFVAIEGKDPKALPVPEKKPALLPAGTLLSYSAQARKLVDATLLVHSSSLRGEGKGSAVVVKCIAEGGAYSCYALTDYHVLGGVLRNGTEVEAFGKDGASAGKWPAETVSFDAKKDIALIRITVPRPLPVVPIASSGYIVRPGDAVSQAGCAYGQVPSLLVGEGKCTVVSCDKGSLECVPKGEPGRSGGGLFNAQGQLVGISISTSPTKAQYTPLEKIISFLEDVPGGLGVRIMGGPAATAGETPAQFMQRTEDIKRQIREIEARIRELERKGR